MLLVMVIVKATVIIVAGLPAQVFDAVWGPIREPETHLAPPAAAPDM